MSIFLTPPRGQQSHQQTSPPILPSHHPALDQTLFYPETDSYLAPPIPTDSFGIAIQPYYDDDVDTYQGYESGGGHKPDEYESPIYYPESPASPSYSSDPSPAYTEAPPYSPSYATDPASSYTPASYKIGVTIRSNGAPGRDGFLPGTSFPQFDQFFNDMIQRG